MRVKTHVLREGRAQKPAPPGAPSTAIGAPPPASAGTPAPLSATAEQVRGAADAVAAARSRQGGPDLSRRQPFNLLVTYDPSACGKARRLSFMLRGEAPIVGVWQQRSGVDPQRMLDRTEKYDAAYGVRSAAEMLDGAIGDSLALVQRAGLRLARRLKREIDARLSALPPTDPRRRPLEARSARVRDKYAALVKALLARAKKTRDLKASLDEKVRTARKKTELTQALIAIRDGQPVDPQLEAETLDAYLRSQGAEGPPADTKPKPKRHGKTR